MSLDENIQKTRWPIHDVTICIACQYFSILCLCNSRKMSLAPAKMISREAYDAENENSKNDAELWRMQRTLLSFHRFGGSIDASSFRAQNQEINTREEKKLSRGFIVTVSSHFERLAVSKRKDFPVCKVTTHSVSEIRGCRQEGRSQ